MNLKKLFATSAILTLAVSTFAPAINSAKANYNAEINSAYSYAYEKNVTTLPTVESAFPMGKAIRSHVAKMISNWALVVLNKQPNEAITPVFTDIAGESEELQGYIKKSAQQGLMGQGITEFMPKQEVTRAQFGTALSRALFGNKYDGGTPYYVNHLENLKKLGVMNDITNPERPILRYEIWLMLQRSEKLTTKDTDDGLTPEQILGCLAADDYLACLEKAKEETKEDTKEDDKKNEVVRKGDLAVSVTDHSNIIKSAPKGIFVANTIRFAASEKINLDTLTLKRVGLGSQKDINKVWLEKNGVAVTNAASVGSDGLAVLNFRNNRNEVTSDAKTQNLELVVEIDKNATVGAEFAFDIEEVTASAKDITVEGTTSTYRVSAYNVVNLTVDIVNKNGLDNSNNLIPIEYKLGSRNDYIIGEFSLSSDSFSDDRDITVRSLTFRNAGSLDFDDTFKNVRVYRDSKVVSNDVEVNGKDITISLDKDAIKANRKAIYTIRAEVANLEDVSKTVQLVLRNEKDVIADEIDTQFRTVIKFGTAWWIAPNYKEGELALYEFLWGKVMFEGTANFPRVVNVGVGASDVVVAKGKIVVTEPIELPTLKIPYDAAHPTVANNKWSTNDGQGKDTIRRLVLTIGDKRYSADPDSNGDFEFTDVIVRETSDIELLVSLKSNVTEGKVVNLPNIGSTLMVGKGYYQNNDSDLTSNEIAGVIQSSKVLIKKAKFTITTDSVSTQETVINDASVKTLMKGKLEAKDKDINVNSFEVKLAWTNLGNNESVEVMLDLNGQAWANATLKNGNGLDTYTFNSLGSLKAGESLPYEIRVQPTISVAKTIYLEVKAKGTDSNGNPAETSTEYSATLDVRANAAIEVANTTTSYRVIEPNPNAVLYQGELNVKNGSTTLTQFDIVKNATPAGLTVTNYKLYVDGDFVEEVAADNAATISFAGLNQNLEQGKRNIEVKAKVESSASVTPTDYLYEITDVKVNNVASGKSAKTYFAKGFFKLAKTSTTDSVLTVKLVNNSSKTINIKAITFADGTKVASASVNNQNVTVNGNEGTFIEQTVIAGGEIEIQVIAKNNELAKLTGVTYDVNDGGIYTYKLDDTISEVGSWGHFFSSK